ncbi:hypothetical protein GCM10028818_49290 [Spirosoma horti]
MRFLIYSLAFLCGFIACSKSETVTPDALTGVWVEETAGKDTLIFNLDQSGNPLPNTLLVRRGKEINPGGFLVPKLGSGIYQYSLLNNRISVRNGLSSSSQLTDYWIEQSDKKLLIDNFFELSPNQPATATRTLVRL